MLFHGKNHPSDFGARLALCHYCVTARCGLWNCPRWKSVGKGSKIHEKKGYKRQKCEFFVKFSIARVFVWGVENRGLILLRVHKNKWTVVRTQNAAESNEREQGLLNSIYFFERQEKLFWKNNQKNEIGTDLVAKKRSCVKLNLTSAQKRMKKWRNLAFLSYRAVARLGKMMGSRALACIMREKYTLDFCGGLW